MSLFGRTKDMDADLRRHDGLDGDTSTSTRVGIAPSIIKQSEDEGQAKQGREPYHQNDLGRARLWDPEI